MSAKPSHWIDGDLVAHLRLARHRLDDLAEDDADADAGADGAEAAADAERDRLAGVGAVIGGLAKMKVRMVASTERVSFG